MDSFRRTSRALSSSKTSHNPRSRSTATATTQADTLPPHDIRLTRADVDAAFAFFDVQNRKRLRPRDLKTRLSAFYPNMTNKELKFLLDESADGSFTADSLWAIIDNYSAMHASLMSTGSLSFDPVREAFKIYDPQGRGVVDEDVLSDIMRRIGLGDLSREEMDLLVQTADFDKDGSINIEDFRNLLKIAR